MKAVDFADKFEGRLFEGCVFDPPYSLRQMKECYIGMGIEKLTVEESRDANFGKTKTKLAPKIKRGVM